MEPQRTPDEPTSSQTPTPARRAKPKLRVIRKTTYTLEELPALLEELRHQEPSPEEIRQLERAAKRAERLRAKLAGIDIDVDELIRQAREEMAGG